MKNRFVYRALLGAAAFCSALTISHFSIESAHAERVGTKASKRVVIKAMKKQIAKKGLVAAPPVDQSLKAQKKKKKKRSVRISSDLNSAAVSGQPPLLVEMPQIGPKNIFWRDGVIDALASQSPEPSQCSEFFFGENDGDSGGMGACHMAETVGRSFQSILESQSSSCYMKNFPTEANVAAGAVAVRSGELPEGGITKLFAPPAGDSARLVKVNVTGEQEGAQTVFIRVASQGQNSAAGNMYEAKLWFCSGSDQNPNGSDSMVISKNGQMIVSNVSEDLFSEDARIHSSEVKGVLTMQGNRVVFDASKARTAQLASVEQNGRYFVTNLSITAANKIFLKARENREDGLSRRYVISRFSGNGADSLRFLEGAFAEDNDHFSFLGATEYRGSYYASAPDSALIEEADAFDFDTDEFFSEAPPSGEFSVDESCSATADIEIDMDMSHPVLQASVSECRPALENMHFCFDDQEVRAAEQGFFSACSFNDGPPEE